MTSPTVGDTIIKTMKKYMKIILGVVCAVAVATSTLAASTNAPVAVKVEKASESWMLTLGGIGATTTKGESQSAIGADLSIGRTGKLILPITSGIRQSIAYASPDGGNVVLTSKVFNDFTLFSLKCVDVFAGGNIGVTYGDVAATWTYAPEAGVRVWIKDDVAIVGRVEYPYDINSGGYRDVLVYSIGFQIKF